MNVFEIKLKVFLLKDIEIKEIQTAISSFIDKSLAKDKELLELHNKNTFKYYCFDSLYPIGENNLYKRENVYTLRIRTISIKLAEYFLGDLPNEYDENLKGLVAEIKILPKKHLDKIYALTPVVIKNNDGYWKNKIALEEYERRLTENLIKKYNSFTKTRMDEEVELYNSIEFKNQKPISIKYKKISLLGDKVSLKVADDKLSQELAYMCLGTGLGELNARGLGFMNYRWL